MTDGRVAFAGRIQIEGTLTEGTVRAADCVLLKRYLTDGRV